VYLKNTSWLLLDRSVRIIGGLFIGIWIARYLGPKNFGILNYALAYVAFFNVFFGLGLNQIVVRELVKYPKLTNYTLGTAFGLKFFGAFLAMIGIYASLFFIQADNVTKLVIFFLTLRIIFQSVDVVDYFFQAKVISKYTVIARGLAFLSSSLLNIYFILNEYSVVYFALSLFIDLLLSALFLLIIYHKNGHVFKQWRFSKKIAINLMKFAWPLALSVFLISIHTKIDQVMIGNMLDIEQVGIYSVAVKLSDAWLFFPAILVSTFMPYFVDLREVDKKLYQYRLIQLYSLMFWMGVFVGLVIMLFGESIISLLFGEVYTNAYMALVFNIWNGIFISQAIARGIWMISENLQIYRLYSNIIVAVLNISINILLIPIYGIAGAAIATLITQFIGTWVISLFWKPLRQSTYDMIKSINPIYLIKFIFKNEQKY
jgi:O-antigen/teichoic acid export membrane protein